MASSESQIACFLQSVMFLLGWTRILEGPRRQADSAGGSDQHPTSSNDTGHPQSCTGKQNQEQNQGQMIVSLAKYT